MLVHAAIVLQAPFGFKVLFMNLIHMRFELNDVMAPCVIKGLV